MNRQLNWVSCGFSPEGERPSLERPVAASAGQEGTQAHPGDLVDLCQSLGEFNGRGIVDAMGECGQDDAFACITDCEYEWEPKSRMWCLFADIRTSYTGAATVEPENVCTSRAAGSTLDAITAYIVGLSWVLFLDTLDDSTRR